MAGRQHYINIHVANVRGPAEPLYLAGARLTTAFPRGSPECQPHDRYRRALPYTNQLNITAVADRDRCPDPATFTTGLNRSMARLIQATTSD